jgi:hypothetical protein
MRKTPVQNPAVLVARHDAHILLSEKCTTSMGFYDKAAECCAICAAGVRSGHIRVCQGAQARAKACHSKVSHDISTCYEWSDEVRFSS